MDLVVVALFWSFCAWLLLRRSVLLAFAGAIVLAPFGSWAAVPTELTGGVVLLPARILAAVGVGLFLLHPVARAFVVECAFSLRRLGLLTAFMVTAALSAVFYPRIFAGTVEVVPMRGEDLGGYAGRWELLAPSAQNLTQLGYLLLGAALIFCFAFLLRFPRYQQTILQALAIGGTLAVATGVLDYASQFVDLSFLLEPFRTASYALIVDAQIEGSKRVVGLMPEASSFGPMCLGQAILLHVWADAIESRRLRRYCKFALVPALLLFAFLSTSSATFVGIGVAAAVLGLRAGLRIVRPRLRGTAAHASPVAVFWILAAAAGCALLAAIYAVQPRAFAGVEALIDELVFHKTSSSSFEERMSWNRVSLRALWDTYGVGVGVGGTRASSWPVSVLTNVGIPGTLLLFGFMAHVLLRPKTYRHAADAVLCRGALWAIVPLLSTGVLSATSPTIGMGLALILGIHAACGPAGSVAVTQGPPPVPSSRPIRQSLQAPGLTREASWRH